MRIWFSGACGYVGSLLVPKLLAEGYEVVGFDTQWFGDAFLPKNNPKLTLIKGDLRDPNAVFDSMKGCDTALHLGCLSNDVSCQLDEELSHAINIDSFVPVVQAAKDSGIKRFIYCSSSSVYGVSNSPEVFENEPRIPLTLYNRSKMLCEDALWPFHADDFTCVALRPATVCGYAPRMRFDLTVNIMTMHAIKKGVITVFGGSQKRPNLHIDDMCAAYLTLLKAPTDKIAGEVFNVGRQNMSVLEIAQLIQKVVFEQMQREVPIKVEPSQDNRSYHVNSDKIARVLGFVPQKSVEAAITDICVKFKQGYWVDALENPIYTNVKQYVDKYNMGKR